MRNVIVHRIWPGLIVVLSFIFSNAYSQSKWLQNKVEIVVPGWFYNEEHNNFPHGGADTASYGESSCEFLLNSSYNNYFKRTGDSIFISWSQDGWLYGYGDITETWSMHFIFDSTERKFREFYIERSADASSGQFGDNQECHLKGFLECSSLDFIPSPTDSLITVSLFGKDFLQTIDTADYISEVRITHSGRDGSFEGVYFVDMDYRQKDTSGYKCILIFVRTELQSSVSHFNFSNKTFKASISFPNHRVHFSFPNSNEDRLMRIYDVVGRETGQIEIPVGTEAYDILDNRFKSGYYFARLGNLGASFVVQ